MFSNFSFNLIKPTKHGGCLTRASNCLLLMNTQAHPPVVDWVRVVHLLLNFLCCIVFLCFVCLRSLSCVPNVASVSGLSIWITPSVFSNFQYGNKKTPLLFQASGKCDMNAYILLVLECQVNYLNEDTKQNRLLQCMTKITQDRLIASFRNVFLNLFIYSHIHLIN